LPGLATADGPCEVTALARQQLDVTDGEAIRATLAANRPDLVLNCAAYTAVDRAESEVAAAYALNAEAPARLAQACHEQGAVLIHFSTDYVFDGQARTPYREEAPTAPLGVYGASKLVGEQAVLAYPEHIVLRLSWVYGHDGANFYKTMLRLASERRELRVVADQFGVPNYTGDLADALAIMLRPGCEPLRQSAGLYHLSAQGPTSWHEFAAAIIGINGLAERIQVVPISTADYPTPARRPAYSVLDASRFCAVFGWTQPDWREGLQRAWRARSANSTRPTLSP
jgi:dTDP-4-dehydrorhamnose reductase (EC 1.1.1.133)